MQARTCWTSSMLITIAQFSFSEGYNLVTAASFCTGRWPAAGLHQASPLTVVTHTSHHQIPSLAEVMLAHEAGASKITILKLANPRTRGTTRYDQLSGHLPCGQAPAHGQRWKPPARRSEDLPHVCVAQWPPAVSLRADVAPSDWQPRSREARR